MPAYPHESIYDGGVDRAFHLVLNGFVSLFYRRALLDDLASWLLEHGYDVSSVDCAGWVSEADMHAAIATTLKFPSY